MGDSNSSASIGGLNATETPELDTAPDDLSAGNATSEVSSWDALYGRFTERNAGACLNPDEVRRRACSPPLFTASARCSAAPARTEPLLRLQWGVGSDSAAAYGDPLTFLIRLIIGVAVALGFLKWHLASRNDWPTKRFIPDLQNKGPHRAKVQCLLFNCFPANAHFGCKVNLLPVPTKPCEFIDTGMWQAFVFTWPYMPRFDEPLMTQTARETVSIMVLAIQLLFFVGLGSAAATISDVRDQGVSFGAMLALINVYIVSVVCAVAKLGLLYGYGYACKRGGLTLLVASAIVATFLGLIILGMTAALTKLSCADFASNVVLPFLMKQPLALLGAPAVYAFRNSFGAGAGVTGICKMWNEIDGLSASECAERLTAAGRRADLHSSDKDGKITGRLEDCVADAESGDEKKLRALQRALKETVYVLEVSLLHELEGLTQRNKDGELKADRAKLLKKLGSANAIGVMAMHPERRWRVSDTDDLKNALLEKPAEQAREVLMETEMVDGEVVDATESGEPAVATEDLRILLKELLWCEFMCLPSMSDGKTSTLAPSTFEVSSLNVSAPIDGAVPGVVGSKPLGSARQVSRDGVDLTRRSAQASESSKGGKKSGKGKGKGRSKSKGKGSPKKKKGSKSKDDSSDNPVFDEETGGGSPKRSKPGSADDV